MVVTARLQLTSLFRTSRGSTAPDHHTQEHNCEKLVSRTTQRTIQHEVDDICCCGAADDVSRDDDPGTQREETARRRSAALKCESVRV